MAKSEVEKLVDRLSKTYGTLRIPGAEPEVYEYISTGNKAVDLMLDGGIAWGYISEFSGKSGCFGKGTEVLMYDGSTKKVEDIKVGDQLMGDDSTPRNVLSLIRGEEPLYEFSVNTAKTSKHKYIFNENHILHFRCTDGGIIDETVKNYLNWNPTKKRHFMFYKVPIEFSKEEKELPIDPYILGLWLGDGASNGTIYTTQDKSLVEVWREYLDTLECDIRKKDRYNYYITGKIKWKNKFIDLLRSEDLLQNKHIPKKFLLASRNQRFDLLAGLIDSDGHKSAIHKGSYDITQKNTRLAEDILFLVRSLGIHATINKSEKYCIYKHEKRSGIYNRIYLSRGIDKIPCRLNYKKVPKGLRRQRPNLNYTVSSVIPLGVGDYYGFNLDGNHRFVDATFTVLHNSGKTLMLQLMLADAQKRYNAIGVWLDRERAFFSERSKALGIDLNRTIVVSPADIPTVPDAEKILLDILKGLPKNEYVFIAIDSLSAFGFDGKSDMGRTAKNWHGLFRAVLPFITSKVSFNFANQRTFKIGVLFGNPETTTGGEAPRFYSTYRIKLEDKKEIKDPKKGNEVLGNYIHCYVEKTRRGPNHRSIIIPFFYSTGIPELGGYVRLLASRGYVKPNNKTEFKAFNNPLFKYNDVEYSELEIEKFLEDNPNLLFTSYPEYCTGADPNDTVEDDDLE